MTVGVTATHPSASHVLCRPLLLDKIGSFFQVYDFRAASCFAVVCHSWANLFGPRTRDVLDNIATAIDEAKQDRDAIPLLEAVRSITELVRTLRKPAMKEVFAFARPPQGVAEMFWMIVVLGCPSIPYPRDPTAWTDVKACFGPGSGQQVIEKLQAIDLCKVSQDRIDAVRPLVLQPWCTIDNMMRKSLAAAQMLRIVQAIFNSVARADGTHVSVTAFKRIQRLEKIVHDVNARKEHVRTHPYYCTRTRLRFAKASEFSQHKQSCSTCKTKPR